MTAANDVGPGGATIPSRLACDLSAVLVHLEELIEMGREVGEGFEAASEVARDSRARSILMRAALQRTRFVHELQSEVRDLGGDPSACQRRLGHLQRSWLALHVAQRERDIHAAIAACASGDHQTLDAYRAVIAAEPPQRTRALLRRQELEIEMLHGALAALDAEQEQGVAG
jgi:uncharacterized protein (TIGR02284 family)